MRLGELLVQEKAITEEQLGQALGYQKENPEVRIGVALVKLGFVDMKTLVGTLAKQKPHETQDKSADQRSVGKGPDAQSQAMKLGQMLLKDKSVTPDQLRQAMEHQSNNPGTIFGQALVELGFVTEEIITATLQKQEEERVSVPTEQGPTATKLGEALLVENVITEEQLRHALQHQKENPGTMLGEALISLGFVTPEDISKVLENTEQEP